MLEGDGIEKAVPPDDFFTKRRSLQTNKETGDNKVSNDATWSTDSIKHFTPVLDSMKRK